jgi:PAS domain S-box-containing protein
MKIKEISKKIKEDSFLQKNILNLMPTPLILVEADTAKVIFANKAADALAGGSFPKDKPWNEYDSVYFCYDEKGHRIPNDKMPGVRAAKGEVLRNFQMDWDTSLGRKSLLLNSDKLDIKNGNTDLYVITFQDVTELKNLESAHKKSKEKSQASEIRYRTMFEQSPFSIQTFAPDGTTLKVNKAWEDLWGVSEDKILGYNVLKDKQLVETGTMPYVKKGFEGEPTLIPAIKYDPNQTLPDVSKVPYLWVRAYIYPVKNEEGEVQEVVLMHEDVTRRKIAEEERRQAIEEADNFFNMPDLLLAIADTSGYFKRLNPAWTKSLGYTEKELTSKLWLDFVHPEDKEKTIAAGAVLKKGKSVNNFQNRYRCKDGTYRWFIWNVRPVNNVLYAAAHDITPIKDAEEKLQFRTALLEAQNEAIPDGILIVDKKGKMLTFNRRFAEMWKMPKKIMNSRDDSAALRFAMGQLENPQAFIEKVNSIYANPDQVSHEEFRFKDGRVFYRYGAPVKNEQGHRYGWAWYFRDITRRKNNEKSLLRQSKVLESMAEGVSVTDENGIIVLTNPAEDAMFGYKRGELIGKHITVQNAYPKKENERIVSEVIETLNTKGVWFGEWENRRKDGTVFQTAARISAIEMDGKKYWICVQEDITKRKQAEREAATLTQQRSELISLNKAKDEFISLASHQLRTPATGVKQYLGLVLEGYTESNLTKEDKAMLEVAYESNERQLQIIDDLLKVAGVDSGKVAIKMESFDLVPLINNIIKEQHDQFKQRSQKVILHSETPKIFVKADKAKIRMVLENIIDNASKYTYLGKSIEIKVSKQGANFCVAVKDQGVGIRKKDFDKLFQKFSRIDNPLSIKVGGTGLGLYWAKRIMDLHDGDIKVSTKPGKGSAFTIVLPAGSKKNV